MGSRNVTIFRRLANFSELLDRFEDSVVASIIAHIMQFERAWKVSRHDGEIPSGFHFEAYLKVNEPYRLCQIRVGPKHGYRALVMLLDGNSDAYWIYIFKKVKDRQPEDMSRARLLAERHWNELKRRDDNGSKR